MRELPSQVSRLMASPRLESGMRTFFSDFLELDTLDTISKDPTIYPKFNDDIVSSAREETLRTVIDLTLKKDGDFRDLFTTRKTYINRPLAWIYDVPYNLEWRVDALRVRRRRWPQRDPHRCFDAEHVFPSRTQFSDQARRRA